jgi:hypothetical protein
MPRVDVTTAVESLFVTTVVVPSAVSELLTFCEWPLALIWWSASNMIPDVPHTLLWFAAKRTNN